MIVLAQVDAGRVSLIAGVTKDLTDRITAGDAINVVAGPVGAKGGGRPDMARAGGGDKPEALEAALATLVDWVGNQAAARSSHREPVSALGTNSLQLSVVELLLDGKHNRAAKLRCCMKRRTVSSVASCEFRSLLW